MKLTLTTIAMILLTLINTNAQNLELDFSHGLTQISDNVFWVIDEYNENPKELKDYNQYLQFFIKLKMKNLP